MPTDAVTPKKKSYSREKLGNKGEKRKRERRSEDGRQRRHPSGVFVSSGPFSSLAPKLAHWNAWGEADERSASLTRTSSRAARMRAAHAAAAAGTLCWLVFFSGPLSSTAAASAAPRAHISDGKRGRPGENARGHLDARMQSIGRACGNHERLRRLGVCTRAANLDARWMYNAERRE